MNPLAKKLLVKPGKRWLFYNAPDNFLSVIEPLPEGAAVSFSAEGEFAGVLLFVKNSNHLADSLKVVIQLIKPDTVFWVCYPKKSSGLSSDLEMMGSWDQLAVFGLRIVASAAVDETWTALRFRPKGQAKLSDSRNSEIRNNEYAGYIDVDKKQVNLPADVERVLAHSPAAMAFYQGLSYSNKKEYIVWILSAKQEKTRLERLQKMLEKLLTGKRNPSEK